MSELSTDLSTPPRATPSAHTADDLARAVSRITPSLQKFADTYIRKPDVTAAYLISHPDCKSARHAKTRGRALLKDSRVEAYLAARRSQALDPLASDGDKLAWELELKSVAFAHFNPRKVPVKEKVTALRALGEAKGWLKPQAAGAGLRATFNFRIGGQASPAGRGEPQTVTVDVDASEAGSDAPEPTTQAPRPQLEVDVTQDPAPRRPMFDASNS